MQGWFESAKPRWADVNYSPYLTDRGHNTSIAGRGKQNRRVQFRYVWRRFWKARRCAGYTSRRLRDIHPRLSTALRHLRAQSRSVGILGVYSFMGC